MTRQFNERWARRFVSLAKHVAQWSKDPSTQVGAVITDDCNRIVSLGYNGLPRGVADTHARLGIREAKLNLIIHAEVNAILFAQGRCNGATLHVWPMPPCVRCATQIIQAGIKTVVSPPCKKRKWQESCSLAREIMEEAGVAVYECEAGDVYELLGETLVIDF